MKIATSELAFQGRKSIDHIALSDDWVVGSLDVISNIYEGENSQTISELSPTCLPSTCGSLDCSCEDGPLGRKRGYTEIILTSQRATCAFWVWMTL